MELKIRKFEPIKLDCFKNGKYIGTVENSIELFRFRCDIAKYKISGCSVKISKENKNFDFIDDDDMDIVINIDQNGKVDKWFNEFYFGDVKPDFFDGIDIAKISVYSEPLSLAMKLATLQKDDSNEE